MTAPPIPVVFEPILKPKPWGGRRLATLLGKRLPGTEPIGESWELADLPGNESRVRDGPLAGRTLGQLVQAWGPRLLGDAELVDGRFPLLVKFIDACDNVSIQVHPKPRGVLNGAAEFRAGIKHEAWYVLHADPGAKVYIGLKPGVGAEDVRHAVNASPIAGTKPSALVDLLQTWEVTPGECYYLPSGTPHALGAGVVVAEVQTPSDVTHRLYDWGRVGLDGRPRELHIEQALANIRYDVTTEMIRGVGPPRPTPVTAGLRAGRGVATDSSSAETRHNTAEAAVPPASCICACDRFTIDRFGFRAGFACPLPVARMVTWIALCGTGRLLCGDCERHFVPGDVVLIHASPPATRVETTDDCMWLEVGIPAP